jgi:gentisate 1,2-dioxygenase
MQATRTETDTIKALCADLESAALDLPGLQSESLIQPKREEVRAHHWPWRELEAFFARSTRFLTPGEAGAERRILRLANPGIPDKTVTLTMSVSVQYLLPGEVAPAHRHTPCAIRFFIRGRGACTTVEGEKCVMQPGDLVLTPPMMWHDHGNEGTEPVIWIDALDFPLVRHLDAVVYEHHGRDRQDVSEKRTKSDERYTWSGLKPATDGARASPLIHFRWTRTAEALRRLGDVEASPFDDVAMEYVNPSTGTSLFPTMGCWIQAIRPQIRTRAHRQTSSAVYYAFSGRGTGVVGGRRIDWEPGDFFVVPPWTWHEFANDAGESAVLFSVQDVPALAALGLYREEPHPDGHQRAGN